MAKGRGAPYAAAGAGTTLFFGGGGSKAPRTKTNVYINPVPTITRMAGTRTGRDEDALSEIVGFVLILALVVVASTLYLMYVVPAEGREDEITHLNKVQDRFVSYKTSVDGLWMRSLADLSVPGTRGVSLSTSFDLGTGGGNTQSSGLFLSFMRPIGTAARMQTRQDSTPATPTTERIGLAVDDIQQLKYTDSHNREWDNVAIGSLSYHTDNYYWIQQNYYYKLGGVFLEQPNEGVSVKVAPPIAIYGVTSGTGKDAHDAVKVSISLVNVASDDSTVGGTGPLRVETRLRESIATPYRNQPVGNVVLSVTTLQNPDGAWDREWLEAWRQVFVDAAQQSGVAGPYDETNEWIEILPHPSEEIEEVDTVVQLKIRHLGADLGSKDVFLDLNEANLQVTFEYAED